jgi:hypothetical protein
LPFGSRLNPRPAERKKWSKDDNRICAATSMLAANKQIGKIRSDGLFPNWRATADEDGHYCFAVAL